MPEIYLKCPECGGSGEDPETPGWGVACSYCDGTGFTGFVEYVPDLTDPEVTVLLSAFRYALERHTYLVSDVISELMRLAPQIPPSWRSVFVKDITAADASGMLPAIGDEIDAMQWRAVRDRFVALGVGDDK